METNIKAATIAKGSRVTGQPKTWYDGEPIKGWPDPAYLGTVRRIENLGGVPCARVKYDSGRIDWRSLDELYAAEGGA